MGSINKIFLYMNLKHFQAFVTVARHLHFTKAAEELLIAQPSLSLLIKQLEDGLGLTLIDRNTRQVGLTEMGEEFLPLARNVVNDFGNAIAQMKDIASLNRGKVSVAAYPSVSSNSLPELIVTFKQRYPNITVQIYEGIYDSIIDQVRSGQADFGIVTYSGEIPGFIFEKLYDDEILLLVPKSHALASVESVSWIDIIDQEIIMLSADTGVRRSIDKEMLKYDLTLKTVLEPALIHTVAALVAAGAGLGVTLSSYQKSLQSMDVVAVPIVNPLVTRPVGIISHKDRQPTPAATTLLDMLVKKLSVTPAIHL
jgi:LysR family carnitine catabolism transcriptional activator